MGFSGFFRRAFSTGGHLSIFCLAGFSVLRKRGLGESEILKIHQILQNPDSDKGARTMGRQPLSGFPLSRE